MAAFVAAVALWYVKPWQEEADPLAALTWGEITRADLEVVVSSTGSLEAIDSVEVGTQVSGTLAEVRADFNDTVRRGQVLATIDPQLLDASLREAEAGLERNRAQLAQAEADLGRQRELLAAGLTSESEFAGYGTAVATARANLQSAEAQLARARENRAHAVIVAPIDGVVIERAVESGQTVAASFNTPRLFLLARDLGEMRILAEVDEGDIGQIQVGQAASFVVAAHPDLEFGGAVEQIRLQPKVEQNVVKYTVVVSAGNEQGLLLPGMTAMVDFRVETAIDVLTAPLAATRVQPNAAMLAEVEAGRAARRARREAGGEAGSEADGEAGGEERGRGGGDRGGRGGFSGDPGGFGDGPPGEGRERMPSDRRRIWVRNEDGRLAPRPVRLGLSDGRRVEIRPLFGEIAPGTEVVVGVPSDGSSAGGPGRGPRGLRIF